MKNRAKCKLCKDILESFHRYDYVVCKCGEISIDGGNEYLNCSAKNWDNFLRVDDEGNEIIVKEVKGSIQPEAKPELEPLKPTKQEMIEMLDAMVKNIEDLPQHAMTLPISHYDLYSFMMLIAQILRQ